MQALDNRRSSHHLIRQILNRNANVPNFAIFLWSGCSANSRVKTGSDLVETWRTELYRRSGTKEDFNDWVQKQDWYEQDEEYATLFEQMYDQPSQRRVYIEECLKDGHPSWGYVYLTNLLSKKIFDVVFTTNFDDLINEACYLYSPGLRPVVAAHDSAISGVRVISDRPKIIKLHGDFLFDNIKNTLHELETLEENTKKKLKQFAQEYGIVVIGYSGRDRSVMDNLEVLLRGEDYFKQGIYWCARKGDFQSKKLRSLLRRDRVYLVEMDGFDEFMAELHEHANLQLPDPIAKPFDVARERARLFIKVPDALTTHQVIAKHVEQVLAAIESGPKQYVPSELQGVVLKERGDLEGAIVKLKDAYYEADEDPDIAFEVAEAMALANKQDELMQFTNESSIDLSNKTYFLLRAGDNEGVLRLTKNWEELSDTDAIEMAITGINRAIALKRLGRGKEMESVLDRLDKRDVQKIPDYGYAIAAGMAALRGKKDELLHQLRKAIQYREVSKESLLTFPAFEDFRNDKDFLDLVRITPESEDEID